MVIPPKFGILAKIFLVVFVGLLGVGVGILVLSGLSSSLDRSRGQLSSSSSTSSPNTSTTGTTLWGTAGYAPSHFAKPQAEDVIGFWVYTNDASEIYGVHTDWQDTKIVDNVAQSVHKNLVVVLGFQEPAQWKNDVAKLQAKIESLLTTYRTRIKYLAIGNEVNLLALQYPKEFKDFEAAITQVIAAVKPQFPGTKFFTTFQYDTLKGDGYLTGKKGSSDWGVFDELLPSIDLVGITMYPHFDYKSPQSIPGTYLEYLTKRLNGKGFVVTETGWPSRESYGGKLKAITDQGYVGSEKDQVSYLELLQSWAQKYKPEFVNWLFLNDVTDWKNGDSPANQNLALFDSLALKHYDGTGKLVWDSWLKLAAHK